jgi:hypothetical protein
VTRHRCGSARSPARTPRGRAVGLQDRGCGSSSC